MPRLNFRFGLRFIPFHKGQQSIILGPEDIYLFQLILSFIGKRRHSCSIYHGNDLSQLDHDLLVVSGMDTMAMSRATRMAIAIFPMAIRVSGVYR